MFTGFINQIKKNMFRKIIFLSLVISGVMLSSCSSTGNQAETKAAETVKTVNASDATTLNTVAEGSFVSWRAAHLGGVQPRFGKIFIKDADVKVSNGTVVNASIVMDIASLTVENFPAGAEEIGKLKGHLLSPDLFNAEKFPTAKFELTNLEKATGTYNSKVTGNLTILGVTKSITFNANVVAEDAKVAIRSEDFSIDRTDWGLTYNVEGTAGVPVDYIIANDVGFTINTTVGK